MIKKVNNSTFLLIGIILILSGIFLGSLDFFKEKKDKTFSDMNILLYENENPTIISSEEELENIQEEKEEKSKEEEIPTETEDPVKKEYDYIGVLEIPKINLKRGFVDINSKYNNVDYNITIIKGSTYPEEANNNLILAAHSGNCSVCFFDKLYKLNIGDRAYLNYKNTKYEYKIVDIYEVEKTGKVAIHRDYTKNVLTLITCTNNSKTKQTVYILELI